MSYSWKIISYFIIILIGGINTISAAVAEEEACSLGSLILIGDGQKREYLNVLPETDITLNCTLNQTNSHYQSSSIVFEHRRKRTNVTLSQNEIQIVNNHTAILKIRKVNAKNAGRYFCKIKDGNQKEIFVCDAELEVHKSHEKPIRDFSCVYYHEKSHIECSWQMFISYMKSSNFIGYYEDNSEFYCPDYLMKSGPRSCIMNVSSNSLSNSETVRFEFKFLGIIGNKVEPNFSFKLASITRLEAPANFTFNSETNSLVWDYPNNIEEIPHLFKLLQYKLLIQRNETGFSENINQTIFLNNTQNYFNISNFKTDSNYNFTIWCRINDGKNKFWSPKSNFSKNYEIVIPILHDFQSIFKLDNDSTHEHQPSKPIKLEIPPTVSHLRANFDSNFLNLKWYFTSSELLDHFKIKIKLENETENDDESIERKVYKKKCTKNDCEYSIERSNFKSNQNYSIEIYSCNIKNKCSNPKLQESIHYFQPIQTKSNSTRRDAPVNSAIAVTDRTEGLAGYWKIMLWTGAIVIIIVLTIVLRISFYRIKNAKSKAKSLQIKVQSNTKQHHNYDSTDNTEPEQHLPLRYPEIQTEPKTTLVKQIYISDSDGENNKNYEPLIPKHQELENSNSKDQSKIPPTNLNIQTITTVVQVHNEEPEIDAANSTLNSTDSSKQNSNPVSPYTQLSQLQSIKSQNAQTNSQYITNNPNLPEQNAVIKSSYVKLDEANSKVPQTFANSSYILHSQLKNSPIAQTNVEYVQMQPKVEEKSPYVYNCTDLQMIEPEVEEKNNEENKNPKRNEKTKKAKYVFKFPNIRLNQISNFSNSNSNTNPKTSVQDIPLVEMNSQNPKIVQNSDNSNVTPHTTNTTYMSL